jgi:hypothetical protein
MMNQLQIELAKKLVAHERWFNWDEEWSGLGRADNGMAVHRDLVGDWFHALPDLTDDATAGVLLGMWLETMEVYPLCEALAKAASFAFSLPNATTAEAFALMLLHAWNSQ